MAERPRRERRRSYLVQHALQLKWVGAVVVAMLLAAVLVDVIMVSAGAVGLDETRFGFMVRLKWGAIALGVALALIIVVGYVNLRMTHRVAGPLYRIRRDVHQVRDGDLTLRIALRRGDELQDLAQALNEMLEVLQRAALDAKAARRRLSALVADLPPDTAGRADLQEAVEELGATLDGLVTEATEETAETDAAEPEPPEETDTTEPEPPREEG